MFGFPRVEKNDDFQYKINFLSTVIFQIKYPINNDIITNIAEIKNDLKQDFPISNEIKHTNFIYKNEKTPVLISSNKTENGIEFRHKDNNKILSLSGNSINYTILGNKYENFNKSFNELYSYIEKINKFLKLNTLIRIAIRKVNIYEFTPDENEKKPYISSLSLIFNNSLIENLLFFPNQSQIDSSIIQFNYSDDPYKLILSYGMLKDEIKIKDKIRKLAKLDIDLYNQTNLKFNNLYEEMKKINDSIFDIFEYFISDNLREIMTEGFKEL